MKEFKKELVNHPSHYQMWKDRCGIEVLDITRWMNNNDGNTTKYIMRAGHKVYDGKTLLQSSIIDHKKALVYLQDEIKRLESLENSNTESR